MGIFDGINEEKKPIYTRDEAAKIVEMFEDILVENGVSIPSPEDDERDPEDNLGLYGSTYSDLLDSVEEVLQKMILRRGGSSEKDPLEYVVFGKFSGEF